MIDHDTLYDAGVKAFFARSEAAAATLAAVDELHSTVNALIAERDTLVAEREALARTLALFLNAPISISSLQPILDLARAMNPEAK